MAQLEPLEDTNLDIYGSAELPWSRARDGLQAGQGEASVGGGGEAPRSFWLSTSGSDGRPHTAGVGALWIDDQVWFTSGDRTRKSRHLAANPACAVAVTLPGLDLVIEGRARRVTDRDSLEKLAKAYRAQGWPAQVEGEDLTAPFSAPSAGPAPWHLYVLDADVAFGVATAEPNGATRWRFRR
jgi:pyridoxamine 5'-phosphate oxidase-like protein